MKPRNFPGRVHARRVRAIHREAGNPLGGASDYISGRGARLNADPTVKDTCWRIGGKNRDAITGVAITVPGTRKEDRLALKGANGVAK